MRELDGSSESLAQFVAREARTASDGVLAGTGVIGAVVVGGVLHWRPPAWPVFTAAGLMLLALAVWGAVDRELDERSRTGESAHPFLRATRAAVALVGWAAMLVAVFGLLGVALGTIIS
ncbi:MAG: hypothetical protein HY084_07435 [Gemmatimonadetes bacterium]|nr:hypothetical protein [Gemmatimonadota bacterium]